MDRATMGRNSSHVPAWIVHFKAPTFGGEFCVRVWAKTALMVRTYYTEADYCEGEPAQPSGGASA